MQDSTLFILIKNILTEWPCVTFIILLVWMNHLKEELLTLRHKLKQISDTTKPINRHPT